MAMALVWMKVESKTHPGRYYYFNRSTQTSSWKIPRELAVIEKAGSLDKGGHHGSTSAPIDIEATKPTTGRTSAPLKPRKLSKPLLMQLNMNRQNDAENGDSKCGSVESRPAAAQSSSPSRPTPRLLSPEYCASVSAAHPPSPTFPLTGGEEAMECERWEREEEVAMDVDLSEVEQLQLLSEIKSARSTMVPPSSLESFGIPQDPSPATLPERLYIILDTNVLLSHLQFLVELKDYAIKGVGRPVLVVPWAVMQELDALKSSRERRVGDRARRAITSLHACFSTRHPRVRGETMEEVHTEVNNIAISSNDDRILHCCLLYQRKVSDHQGITVLFSNDIQLCSKAMINGVKALNRKTLLSELRVMCRQVPVARPVLYSQSQGGAPVTRHVPYSQSQGTLAESTVRVELQQHQTRATADDILSEAEKLGWKGLAAAVRRDMREAYGDDLWIDVVAVKPPWTLKDLVHLLDRHWVAVFKFVLDSPLRDVVHLLQAHVRQRSAMIPTFHDVRCFLQNTITLLKGLSKTSTCGDVLPNCISTLQVLAQNLNSESENGNVSQQVPHSPLQGKPILPLGAPLLPSISPPSSSPSPSAEALELLAQTRPVNPYDHLQWVLRLILETTKFCHAQVVDDLRGPHSLAVRSQASWYIKQLCELLSKIITSLSTLTTTELSIPHMQETLCSFDLFLQHIHNIPSPLTVDVFYHLILSGENGQLLQEALQEYMSQLESLQKFARQYNL